MSEIPNELMQARGGTCRPDQRKRVFEGAGRALNPRSLAESWEAKSRSRLKSSEGSPGRIGRLAATLGQGRKLFGLRPPLRFELFAVAMLGSCF